MPQSTSSDNPSPQFGRQKPRRLRAVAVIPTLFTLGNLVCGFAAIHYAAKPIGPSAFLGWSTLTIAGSLVFLGMFFDGIDGLAARLTKSASGFGAQLDSMADMVTFGAAPAFMMLRLVSSYYGGEHYTGILGPDADNIYAKLMWAIAAIYICCAALRLARFNVEVTSTAAQDHRYFRGLPTPGAAGAVASLTLLHQHLLVITYGNDAPDGFGRSSSLLIPLVTILCALAMVSRLRYAHAFNRWFRGKRDFGWLIRVILPLAFLPFWFQETTALLFTFYALSGPLGKVWSAFPRRSTLAAVNKSNEA